MAQVIMMDQGVYGCLAPIETMAISYFRVHPDF